MCVTLADRAFHFYNLYNEKNTARQSGSDYAVNISRHIDVPVMTSFAHSETLRKDCSPWLHSSMWRESLPPWLLSSEVPRWTLLHPETSIQGIWHTTQRL